MSEQIAHWPDAAPPARASAWRGLAALAGRYAPSVLGPISVSAAHFLASLIFLRELPPVHFGQFAFLLVVTPFLSMSSAGSLLLAPLGAMVARDDVDRGDGGALSTLLKAAIVVALLAGLLTAALLLFSHTPLRIALILAPYATFTALRWFGRGIVFADGKPMLAMFSDLTYSVCLVAGLLVLLHIHHFSIDSVAKLLSLSTILGTLALGRSYLKRQYWNLGGGKLSGYWLVWQEYTRWSILGVVLSELTVNAHAYLVTFFSGPKAFAVLAVGSLLTRPVSLVLSALPDFERPRMARAVVAGDKPQALHFVNEFRTAGAAIWVVTLGLAAVLLLWFPNVILRHNYDGNQVLVVVGIWAAIMASRILRTPESVLLQAAGEFKPLAAVSTKSSIASVVATCALLITFGPLAALGGILIGELVMTAATISLFRKWKAAP
jgi:O-antigen/teichoic acid export membrane protein